MSHRARICFQDALEIKSPLRFVDDLTFWWLRRWVNKRNRTRRDWGFRVLRLHFLYSSRLSHLRLCCVVSCLIWFCKICCHISMCRVASACLRVMGVIKMFQCCPKCDKVHVYFYLLTTALTAHVNHWQEKCTCFYMLTVSVSVLF